MIQGGSDRLPQGQGGHRVGFWGAGRDERVEGGVRLGVRIVQGEEQDQPQDGRVGQGPEASSTTFPLTNMHACLYFSLWCRKWWKSLYSLDLQWCHIYLRSEPTDKWTGVLWCSLKVLLFDLTDYYSDNLCCCWSSSGENDALLPLGYFPTSRAP